MIRRWFAPACVLCTTFLAGGCAGTPKTPPLVPITGTVKLDGKPLAEGEITFVGDPGTIPDSLQVRNGAFQGKAKVGKKKVEIRAFRTEKPPPTATGNVTDTQVNYIPEKYNTKTTLSAEVLEGGGLNPDSFEVNSK